MLFYHIVLTCYNLHTSVMIYFATKIWNNSINILDIKQIMDKRGNKKIRLFFFFFFFVESAVPKYYYCYRSNCFVYLCVYTCVHVCIHTHTEEMIDLHIDTLECQPNLSIPRQYHLINTTV